MKKLIAAMNMTLDGYCDHTAMTADDEIHQHYSELLKCGDTVVYGRITYQLMESYWPAVVKEPTGNEATDEFAVILDNISKVVFSRTMKDVKWKNSRLASRSVKEEISELRQQSGGDILVGSPSMIAECLNLNLVDELQICIQPIIETKGLSLFRNINERIDLRLLKTKTFRCGAVTHYYKPVRK